MSKKWVGTSWKMNKTLQEAEDYARELLEQLKRQPVSASEVFIVPPATALPSVARLAEGSNLMVGAQNAHWADSGAWTGELSVPQLKDAGAQLIEVGHSERREHFAETDRTVNLKVHNILAHGLIPLICVGEPDEVRKSGDHIEYVCGQVAAALDAVPAGRRTLVAYEPIWAIGSNGREPEMDEVTPVMAAIHDIAKGRCEAVLYGGSVNQRNAGALISQTAVEGLFIGRAAWEVDGFVDIVAQVEKSSRVGASEYC